jgi:hypothetical protein
MSDPVQVFEVPVGESPSERFLIATVSGKARAFPLDLFLQLEGADLVIEEWRRTGRAPVCDGCSWSPDDWRSIQLWPACLIHDRHYDPDSPLGGTAAGRAAADAIFFRNLTRLLELQGAPFHLRSTLPWAYWSRVRLYGSGSYFYTEGRPEGFWARLKDVY